MRGAAAKMAAEERGEHRDEVFFRARGLDAAGVAHPLVIVNLSPGGLMARADGAFQAGDMLRMALPEAGSVEAEVRWALGGRIGCRFRRVIVLGTYYRLLGAVTA